MRMELKNLIVMLMFLLVVVFAVSTVQAVTVITTAEELQAMADDLNGDYVLGNDIDLTGFDWQRVGPFAGTFSGANHIISGLTMDADRVNLFSVLAASGVVKNVGLTNVNIRAPWYGAALVGDCYGTVSKCYVKGGTVTCVGDENGRGGNFGAVAGLIRNGGIVTDCYASDLVVTFATDLVYWNSQAGFVGGQYNVAANCYFAGTIIRSSDDGGGFLDHFSDNSVTTSCYYDMDLAGFDDGMGMGRTTAEMMTQSTFVGWDFDNTWTMIEGQTYPTLIPEPATTLYVDDDASPDGDGLSWATAFKYLQDGLTVASYGDEVRVAQGTYQPDRNSRNPTGTGSREATFQVKNGVAVYGGYAGAGEPDPNEQDIEAYETILSGDLAGNDGPDFANNGENSYHVVCCSNISETTVLDGFTITAGNANVNPDRNGGGMYNEVTHSNLIVTNCTFIGNSADNSGGGIFNYYFCDLMISDCTFRNNSADYDGGAIYNWLSMPILVNSMFIGNSAGKDGGGIFSNHSGPTLTNCTFIGNSADNYGGGIYSAKVYGDTVLINCIIWGNIADEGSQIGIAEIIMGGGVTFVSYCDIQGAELDVYDPSGMLNWGEGNIGEDLVNDNPLFADADNDDYHLKSQAGRWDPNSESWVTDDVNSPCIDAGDPNSDWTAELWPHGKRINMGAFGGMPQASMSESPAGNIADLDANDVVNYADLKLFTERWLRQHVLLSEDLDRDGSVNFKDFAIFANNWLWEE